MASVIMESVILASVTIMESVIMASVIMASLINKSVTIQFRLICVHKLSMFIYLSMSETYDKCNLWQRLLIANIMWKV